MFSFDNIGGKIKGWAKRIFAIEAIAAVISGIVIMAQDEDMILIGLLVVVFGPIVAWVSTWILYGYGQLIENSDIIAAEYNRKNEKHEKDVAKSNAKKETQRRVKVKATIANPNIADDEYIDITCPNCKEELSYTKEELQSGDVICPMCDIHISI
jgi:DNA-directed RNA polymerase subunit M/transcription elongation factor TFIIS